MKTLIIFLLVVVLGLVALGGGSESFINNVGDGGEKVAQSKVVESIIERGSDAVYDITEGDSMILQVLGNY